MTTRFQIISQDGYARVGKFTTAHGCFDTPQFMPVGSRASVRGVDVERLEESGAQITLVNTYHLWLRPGPELIRDMGGIHRFMNWPGPILSDSGGYQVFSLKGMRTLREEGVEFRSHLDGSLQFLSPEKAIEIQETLGVDIAMVLDECPEAGVDRDVLEKSLKLTLRWARRSFAARQKPQTAIFGITQGGTNHELRTQAAEELASLAFDGMAIGGLSVGEPKEKMYGVLDFHVKQLPTEKIRYLMGVGTPEDLVQAVFEGVDLFDCVMPTRAGRFGRVFIRGETPFLNIKNSQFERQDDSLDNSCLCVACRNYSRAYIHHLFKVGEMLGPQLASIHNLAHYLTLMREIRRAIQEQRFRALYSKEKKRWKEFDSVRARGDSGLG